MVDMICYCGEAYEAKVGDLNRGWGLSCGKACAASRRNSKLPAATRVDGNAISITFKNEKRSTFLAEMERKHMDLLKQKVS